MKNYGFSYGHHDAAVVVMEDSNVVEAIRFYRKDIDTDTVNNLFKTYGKPDNIYLHENKWRVAQRKLFSRDWNDLWPKHPKFPIKPIVGNHHLSHAAAAFYTAPSKIEDALVIVADAIGEKESLAVYHAYNNRLDPDPIFVLKYPHSLGLFYSYHTALIGLIPNQDEGLMMKMSSKSIRKGYKPVRETYEVMFDEFHCTKNLHRYPEKIITDPIERLWIASSAQHVIETYLINLVKVFKGSHENVVFSGGVAYNTHVVTKMLPYCKNIYVPSHPGDAGSCYGAILQHTHRKIQLPNGVMFKE